MGKGKASSNAHTVSDLKRNDRLAKALLKKKKNKDRTYETSDEINFTKLLAEAGFFIRHMDSDGNCMFRSIADQLTGDAQKYDQYRQDIITYIESHEDHFSFFIEDSENFGEYIQRMRQDGEWGDQPELCAAAQCLGVNIFVHQVDSPTYVIRSEAPSARDIHLSYHGGCHYNSVRRLDDDRYGSPAQHQISPISASALASASRAADEGVERVCLAVPWAKLEDVRTAMRMAEGEADVAIEILVSNPKWLSELQGIAEEGAEFTNDSSGQKLGDSSVVFKDEPILNGKVVNQTSSEPIDSPRADPKIKEKAKVRVKPGLKNSVTKAMSKKVRGYSF